MRKTFKWLIALLRTYRFRVLGGSILFALTVLFNAGLLATAAKLLSEAALTSEILLLMPLVTGVRFFGIGRAVMRYFERLLNHSIAFRILGYLRGDFYAHLEPVVPDACTDYSKGKLYNRFITDINTLQYFYLRAVSVPVGSLLVFMVCAVFLGYYDQRLVGVLLIGQIIAGMMIPILSVSTGRGRKLEASDVQGQLSEQFFDYQEGVLALRLFNRLDIVSNAIKSKTTRLTQLHFKMTLKKQLMNRVVFTVGYVTMLWALWLIIEPVQNGTLAGVDAAMLGLLVLASFEGIMQMPEAVVQMDESLSAAGSMLEIYDKKVEKRPLKSEIPACVDIVAENLSFHYHRDNQKLLENINFTIPQGAHVALVGESGSGKSSIARLLSGLWRRDGGNLTLGGTDYNAYSEDALHQLIGTVDQDQYFFYASVRENMQLARQDVTDGEIWQALEMVELEAYFRALPEGLDTILSENASALSSGQRQRLAIAQLVIKNPRIVILDEVTQKLNKDLAARIMQRLRQWSEDKTLIYITHSLSGIASTDFIYVLSCGKIVEQGARETLLCQSDGYFSSLYAIEQSQF